MHFLIMERGKLTTDYFHYAGNIQLKNINFLRICKCKIYFKCQHCAIAEKDTKFFAVIRETLISHGNNSAADLLERK